MQKFLSRYLPYMAVVYISQAIYSILLTLLLLKTAEYTNSIIFLKLNYDAFMQTVVALNTGVLVAIFISLFYGNEASLTIFKKQKKASRQVVLILITNTALVAAMALFANNLSDDKTLSITDLQVWLNLATLSTATVFTISSMKAVYTLIKVSLRKDG